MGLRAKISGFLKETWEGIMSPGPMNEPASTHRAGFGSLHKMLTGNNIPAAYEQNSTPAPKQ